MQPPDPSPEVGAARRAPDLQCARPPIVPGALLPMSRAAAVWSLCLSLAYTNAVAFYGEGRQQPPPPGGTNSYELGPDSQVQAGVPRGRVTQVLVDEQDLSRHGPRLLGVRTRTVRSGRARLRHGVPGRCGLRKGGWGVARACGLRQSHLQKGHASHDRHLHQPRRGAAPVGRGAPAVQPQRRVPTV